MYKVLLAAPTPEPVDAGTEDAAPGAADAGAPRRRPSAPRTPERRMRPWASRTRGPRRTARARRQGSSMRARTASRSDGAVAAAPTMPPPTDVSGAHSLAWKGISDAERATLSNYILGREMPFPPPSGTPLQDTNDPLTLDELERMSLWIAQGAPTPQRAPTTHRERSAADFGCGLPAWPRTGARRRACRGPRARRRPAAWRRRGSRCSGSAPARA